MVEYRRATLKSNMFSELCNISEDLTGNRNGLYQGTPKYLLMDISARTHLDGKRVLILYDTDKKYNFFSSRKFIVLLALCITFVLGFALGTVIPLQFNVENIISVGEQSKYDSGSSVPGNRKSAFITSNSTKGKHVFLRNRFINGIFWTEYVERLLPRGYGEEDEEQWKDFVDNNVIVRIEEGCGRMQNRLVVFADGTKACCRYRPNTDQIQGEIFSYYLGRLLRFGNVVPSALAVVNSSEPLWQAVAAELKTAQWAEGRPVVLTRYVENLLPANIPEALRQVLYNASALRPLKPLEGGNTLDLSQVKTDRDATELAQWSDLIVFDYLTGNLDRVVNNLYNLQWNQNMLNNPTHNLARTTDSQLLVFLDNESGLLHGYRLLNKYEPYHRLLLEGFCVFRRSTVDALADLQSRGIHLPTSPVLPSMPDKNVDILQQRLNQVLHQMLACVRRGLWQN